MSGPASGDIEPVYVQIGRRVRKARNRAKLTQAVVADRTSLSRTSIANIERGEQRFMVHCLLELASALGVSPEKLLPTEAAAETRVQSVIGDISDQNAAQFLKVGLQKAKVLKK
ncbi:helix-turn-helix transcriptional regulator [Microcoleus sp. B7-D4]|uniref:helix-turn-helix transcriptional regulator n=1 Tax=Microcoleus sp. B7-D4 TaxID=2818696 RepID=UPI002FCED9BF